MQQHPANPFLPHFVEPTPPGEDQSPEIAFTPVPRLRKRRNGWSEHRQRLFIAALAGCGSVARAARSVGMTPRSAYRLMDADGADSFAAAWDEAISIGLERVRVEALERALNGAPVAIFRRGKLVRVEQRHNDRLSIALLAGRGRNIDDIRRSAVSRRTYYQELKAADEAAAPARREAEALRAEHQAILDAIDARGGRPYPPAEPRVRRL